VNISNEQRTQIRQSFTNVNIRSVPSVDFSIGVGVVVPAHYDLVDIPSSIVQIVPAWRGYKVIRVGGRVIIIEPGSRRIVTVIEV
jgi:hypothetical protein